MAKLETIGNIKLPVIRFTRHAMKWIKAMVDVHDQEVGWYGLVQETGKYEFTVTEIFYPKHELMTATTCEIDPNGNVELANKLMDAGRDEDVMRIKLWGHSHHNMGVSPSGQDDDMGLELAADNGDYLIRLIANKKGDMGITFYDMKKGLKISDLDYYVDESEEEATAVLSAIADAINSEGNPVEILDLIRVYSEPLPLNDKEYEEIVEEVKKLREVNEPKTTYGSYSKNWPKTKAKTKKNGISGTRFNNDYYEHFYGGLI